MEFLRTSYGSKDLRDQTASNMTEEPSQSPPQESKIYKPLMSEREIIPYEINEDGLMESIDGVTTMMEWVDNRINTLPNHDLYGFRLRDEQEKWSVWKFFSGAQTQLLINETIAAFSYLGVTKDSKVLIFAENCIEWLLCQHACDHLSAVQVPLYNALGVSGIELALTEMECDIICISPGFVPKLEKAFASESISESRKKIRGVFLLNTFDYINETVLDAHTALMKLDEIWTGSELPAPLTTTFTQIYSLLPNPTKPPRPPFISPRENSKLRGIEDQRYVCPSFTKMQIESARTILQNLMNESEHPDAPNGKCFVHTFGEWRQIGSYKYRLAPLSPAFKSLEPVPLPIIPPTPTTVFAMIYTSGSTGKPKAAILDHRSMVVTLGSAKVRGYDFTTKDVHLSYLPLAHVFEKLCLQGSLHGGSSIAFSSDGVPSLMDDIKTLRPTFLVGVPRVFNKIYKSAKDKVENLAAPIRALVQSAMKTRRAHIDKTGRFEHWFLDKTILSSFRNTLGGRLRFTVLGGAPMSTKVKEFIEDAFGVVVLEGYGLTETASCTHVVRSYRPIPEPFAIRADNAGRVIPSLMAKVVKVDSEVAETREENSKYFLGELCVKGTSVFTGYYNRPEETKAVFDADGWFHTGDLVYVDDNENVHIIDRVKSMIKLSNGEWISPEFLEGLFTLSPFVQQVYVHAGPHMSTPAVVILPESQPLEDELKKQALSAKKEEGGPIQPKAVNAGEDGHISPTQDFPYTASAGEEEVKKVILKDLRRIVAEQNLAGYNNPSQVILAREPFSIENGLLTPTLKFRRVEFVKQYFGKDAPPQTAQPRETPVQFVPSPVLSAPIEGQAEGSL
ncbi:putative Long chain acyl-CoA synthetase 7, peroxisomal [Blattamonas nauphoetae]|uniref:Long chain acyl-CoA synthetase 7, peroxisomal n=1 Tax=Blattamonas nauphoetae TaxID=2049346 RepID=A0ABQ9X7J9_9EUKA|nr:putative Long chain acyl-CoA synthetase 7, peroxisomal [Blattamonas nauphoetae]